MDHVYAAPSRPPTARLLRAALLAVLALGLTCGLFLWTRAGQSLDGMLLPRAEWGGGYVQETVLVGPAQTVLARFGAVQTLAVLVGGVVLVGLVGRRLVAGLVGAGAVVCAAVVAAVAKPVLPRPELQVESSTTHNSFPSGHVTVATALLLAFLLVLPPRLRWWLAVPGVAGVSVVAAATMIAGWHRFSDTLGAVLLCVVVFSLAAAGLARRPASGRPVGAPNGGGVRGPIEAAVGMVLLVWGTLVVVPGMAASLARGPVVAVAAATAVTAAAVWSVLFLVRDVDFADKVVGGGPSYAKSDGRGPFLTEPSMQ